MNSQGIVVHGGAINPLGGEFGEGVRQATLAGFTVLSSGGSALDAVTEAVRVMEDNPIFNAGTGSWLNLKGEVEMDAIVVDGTTLRSGAVACITRVRNPVLVARKVMEETDHVLLAGGGATAFARALGFEDHDPVTKERLDKWGELRERLRKGENVDLFRYWSKILKFASFYGGDTVGAVALDGEGRIAAATSSGGFPMKLPGRVGDVPLLACSTYADSGVGGVSLTGQGELAIRSQLAKVVHDFMASGVSAQRAVESAVDLWNKRYGREMILGGIALSRGAEVGVARNLDLMPHAYMLAGLSEPVVGSGVKV